MLLTKFLIFEKEDRQLPLKMCLTKMKLNYEEKIIKESLEISWTMQI